MWDLLIFALIGLLVGGAARVWYPGREPARIMGTIVLGIIGAVFGGLISWAVWSGVDGQIYPGALLTSLSGAVVVIAAWACVAYARRTRARLVVQSHAAPAAGPSHRVEHAHRG